ncbi:MAG: DUF2914 domain-containing protein [Nevskia sp.]|nr:DUF2914 domain-containing protein [Nevskia sp.]
MEQTRAAEALPGAAAPAGPGGPPGRLQRLLSWLERHRLLLACASFAAGSASFALVERNNARVAQSIAILLAAGWLLMLSEGLLARWLAGYRWARLSPLVLRYSIQAVHQQTYFFCLPFLLSTTTWASGQAVFTAAAGAGALVSMWDPLYYGVIAARPWRYLGFHAFAVYLAALTVPPVLWQLTTTQSLAAASAAIGLFALPSLAHLIRGRSLRRWGLLLAAALSLGAASWLLRFWVPPVTLWVDQAVISTGVDTDARQPGPALRTVPANVLAQGLYAFTAIHAPRGLRERVFHRWMHGGREVARIPLDIAGLGRQGYRAWSYKQNFPADAAGAWRVEVVTDAGQLIGEVRFEVVP